MIVAQTKNYVVLESVHGFLVRCSVTHSPLGTRLIKGRNRGDPPPIRNDFMHRDFAIALMNEWEAYTSQDIRKAKKNRRLDAIVNKYEEAMTGDKHQETTGFTR